MRQGMECNIDIENQNYSFFPKNAFIDSGNSQSGSADKKKITQLAVGNRR